MCCACNKMNMTPLMYEDLEYVELSQGPLELTVMDATGLSGGIIFGCEKGLPYADYIFTQLTKEMEEYCNSELGRKPYMPLIEELCIAQCPPHPQWFRAALLELSETPAGQMARVCYVDYGFVETVPVGLLRKMLPEFVRGVPVVVSHLEIKDFPEDASPEMVSRAARHLRLSAAGRGELRVRRAHKHEDGFYVIDAPELLQAMGIDMLQDPWSRGLL